MQAKATAAFGKGAKKVSIRVEVIPDTPQEFELLEALKGPCVTRQCIQGGCLWLDLEVLKYKPALQKSVKPVQPKDSPAAT